MESKEKENDRARSYEQQNVPKASQPSPLLTILHGGEERKEAFERGVRCKEGGGDLWLKRRGLAQSCHSPSNYNTFNNTVFSHLLLQISPLGCRLPILSLLCTVRWGMEGGGVIHVGA